MQNKINMGFSFSAWKAFLILLCLVGFGLTLAGPGIWSSIQETVQEYTGDTVTWNFRYNSEEGNKVSVLREVDVKGQILRLETVSDNAGIQQGLSDRPRMADDQGLLFVMPNVDIHTFWMYHMNFALDMIWLRDGVIVEIARNMPPPSETAGIPKTYTPKALADEVLELTAGGVERYGLKVGDELGF